ncbi:hypothetical protein LXA43DRAFT_1090100 [Ganoderma leucocontextum]|nr:hypothetical protein LXA43DRAFT_1090100 [Ganoderma leucocontextum]
MTSPAYQDAEVTRLAASVYPDVPFPGGVPLNIPERDLHTPKLYHLGNTHPIVNNGAPVGRVFGYHQHITEDGMRALHNFVLNHPLPGDTTEELLSAGYLLLEPDNYIVCHDVDGTGDAKDDTLQLWVTGDGVPHDLQVEFRETRDRNLGPPDLRTPDPPVKSNGAWEGGTAWERDKLAVVVNDSTRSFHLTQSHERARNLTGPCAGSKVVQDITEHNQMRASTVSAAAAVAMASLRRGSQSIVEALEEHAELYPDQNSMLVDDDEDEAIAVDEEEAFFEMVFGDVMEVDSEGSPPVTPAQSPTNVRQAVFNFLMFKFLSSSRVCTSIT